MGLMYLLTYLIFDGHESKQQFLSLNTDSVLFSSHNIFFMVVINQ